MDRKLASALIGFVITGGPARRECSSSAKLHYSADVKEDSSFIHPDAICLSHLDTTRDCQGRYSWISCPDV